MATHDDTFFSPLGRPQDLVRRVDVAGVPGEVRAVVRDAPVAALPRIDSHEAPRRVMVRSLSGGHEEER